MGQVASCISAETIVKIGEKIVTEYFSKSTTGQVYTAIAADNHCTQPSDPNDVAAFLKCLFLKGQKDAWERIIVLFMLLFFATVILGYMLYQKTVSVVSNFRQQVVQDVNLHQVMLEMPQQDPVVPNDQQRTRPRAETRAQKAPRQARMSDEELWA